MQPEIRHNDWSVLDRPALGEWAPRLSVSVVVPAYRAGSTLPYVLAGLAAQSYPAHLMEVVVVDDGNEPPLVLPELRPEQTRVVRVPDGWGRAAALACGVAASDGEVIHRLDADMLPWREEVEAQLRWHHQLDYGVVLGSKWFVEPELLTLPPEQVREVVAAGRAVELFELADAEPHRWVENFWRRSDDLVTAGPRAPRVHVGATGSFRRSLYAEAGGVDPSLHMGEDVELGARFGEAGAVFIPDRESRSWHLGSSTVMRLREQVNRHNDPALTNLVPGMRRKRNRRGRRYEVPYVEVVVPVGDGDVDSDEVIGCVDSILDSTLDDLRVLIVGDWPDPHGGRTDLLADPDLERRIVARAYRGDQRVELHRSLPPGRCRSPFRLVLPDAGWSPRPVAIEALVDDLERTHHGLRLIDLEGATARLERTAAVSRARHLGAGSAAEVDALIDRCFGAGRLSPEEAGWVPTSARVVPRQDGRVRPPVDPAESRERLRRRLAQPDPTLRGEDADDDAPAAGSTSAAAVAADGPSRDRRTRLLRAVRDRLDGWRRR